MSSAERADVYVGDEVAASLQRTKAGSRLSYLPHYLERFAGDPSAAVSLSLPLQKAPIETRGVNLHPFFAGLLPEGLRMRALVRSLKTSEDDLMSMLLQVGADCVGAVSVVPAGTALQERAPIADVTDPSSLDFEALFQQSIDYGGAGGDRAIAGEQRKVSAAMISLPLRSKRRGKSFILKLQPPEHPALLQNEHFFMRLADSAGIRVASTSLLTDSKGATGLLVERFDRIAGPPAQKLHQEDGCQLLERYPADKYRIDFPELLDALCVCSAPKVERMRLLSLQAYSYLIGNGDLHAKNISVRRSLTGLLELSPAYDLLSTLPYGDQSMALSMLGRDKKLQRQHFVQLAARYEIPERAIGAELDRLCKKVGTAASHIDEIGLADKRRRQLEKEMTRRAEALAC